MQATIDRIDEGIAVLITRGDNPVRMTIPSHLLSPACREGDIVNITITPDRKATDAAKDRVSRTIDRPGRS